MRFRRLLIAAVVVAVLAAIAVLLLIQSVSGGQPRAAVEARLSATLGQPVFIGRLGISLFPRVALSGAEVRVGAARAAAPALDIERVRILPRLRALLMGDVVVEQLELEGFVVSVLRDHNGRWHVPSMVPAPTAGESGGAVIERVRITDGRIRIFDSLQSGAVSETASIDGLEGDVTVEGAGLRLALSSGRIGDSNIQGTARTNARAVLLEFGAKDIADDDLPVFLRLLGSERPAFLRLAEAASASVTVQVDRASSRLKGKGALNAPEVALEPLRLQRFEAPFVIDGSRLQFNPTSFAMYRGEHRGAVTMQLGETPARWTTDSRVTNLDVGEFLKALSGRDQRIDGTGTVNAALRGRVGEPLDRTVAGRTELMVTNGIVREFPLLATINRALRLTGAEGNDTRFEKLSATLTIAGGVASTDDLLLQAGHVRVEATGRIGADRSLALRGIAVIAAEHVKGAVARVHELARLRNSRGEIEIPLTISGTLDAPSFGLDLQSAVRKGLADELRRRIRKFIR